MIEPISIEEKPEMTVVGLQTSFIHALSPETTAAKVLGKLWHDFCDEIESIPNRIGADTSCGIIFEGPESERSHPDELQYIAGVKVSSLDEIPAGLSSHVIPAALFATFTHRGPIMSFSETVRQIYREWLPHSEFKHAGVADIELYDKRFDGESEDSEMDYSISVVKKENES